MRNKKNPRTKTPIAIVFPFFASFFMKTFIPHPSFENKGHLLTACWNLSMEWMAPVWCEKEFGQEGGENKGAGRLNIPSISKWISL